MKKELLIWQNFLLGFGTIFASYSFGVLVHRYIVQEGSFMQTHSPLGLINPLLTPCFYGLLVFAATFVWTLMLRAHYNAVSQYRLVWLLALGAMFAWGNYAYEMAQIYGGKVCNLGCTAGYFGMPWFVSCLVGAVLFTLTLVIALAVRRQN